MVQLRQDDKLGPLHVAQDVSQESQVSVWTFAYVPEGHIGMQEF